MKSRSGFTLIELMIVIVILGVLVTIAVPNYIGMRERSKEARVKGVAHTVQLAAEVYAASNDGEYSVAAADLRPLFPRGNLLENPFTRVMSEPQFGAPAAASGQVGIELVEEAGRPVGYTVTGFGKTELIMAVQSGP